MEEENNENNNDKLPIILETNKRDESEESVNDNVEKISSKILVNENEEVNELRVSKTGTDNNKENENPENLTFPNDERKKEVLNYVHVLTNPHPPLENKMPKKNDIIIVKKSNYESEIGKVTEYNIFILELIMIQLHILQKINQNLNMQILDKMNSQYIIKKMK